MTSLSILVIDTNIWIDLENGDLITDLFHLPYKFIITDFAIKELNRPNWTTLNTLGLQVHPLTAEYIPQLIYLSKRYSQLSLTDIATLLVAKALSANLITGDQRLKELAQSQGLLVHGLLWVLDEMVMHLVISENQASIALRKMIEKGARLPNDECKRRFIYWSSRPKRR